MLNKLAWIVASLIAASFVSACAWTARSPIRLTEDVGSYLDVAAAIEVGKPYDAHERPITYPLVVVALRRLGITGNPGLIGFNVVCLAVGLAAFAIIAGRDLGLASWEIAVVVSCTLCSRIVFDLVTMAQPETAYLATTMGAVLCASMAASRRRQAIWIAGAIALTAASIALRTVGIALVPAVLWTFRSKLSGRMWVAAAVTAGCLGLAWLSSTQYAALVPFHSHTFSQTNAPVFVAGSVVRWRLQSIFELFTNLEPVSIARLPGFVRQEVSYLGLLLLMPILIAAWRCRRSTIAAYFAVYCAIIFVWPFSYTRFFMPVVPCLFAFQWLAIRDLWRAVRNRQCIEKKSAAGRGDDQPGADSPPSVA
jgi:hypothetical protein